MRPNPSGSMEPAIRYRTAKRQPLVRDFSNLENPIVIRFINADTEEKLFAFLKVFGLPSPKPERYKESQANVETRAHIVEGQRIFRRLLEMAGSGEVTKAAKAVNTLSITARPMVENSRGKPRPILSADKLLSFMQMEVWMVAVSGARIGRCEYCGDVFLTGKLTENRATRIYCSDKHRVAGNRAKAKNKKGPGAVRHRGQGSA